MLFLNSSSFYIINRFKYIPKDKHAFQLIYIRYYSHVMTLMSIWFTILAIYAIHSFLQCIKSTSTWYIWGCPCKWTKYYRMEMLVHVQEYLSLTLAQPVYCNSNHRTSIIYTKDSGWHNSNSESKDNSTNLLFLSS